MRKFVLIGYPLGHSFSQSYFTQKFETEGVDDCLYSKFPIETIDLLPQMLADNTELCGFNVTIPYKESVIRFLDSLDEGARRIGAVNCVQIRDGRLKGYNTDAYGFKNSILALIGDERPSALVLGTGGASKAIAYVLGELGIDYMKVSRTAKSGQLTYAQIDSELLKSHRLVVNCTPLGTFPNVDTAPDLPYEQLTTDHFMFDVVYNPAVSKFLKQGLAHGAKIMNGHKMLIDQAERSWQIWNEPIAEAAILK